MRRVRRGFLLRLSVLLVLPGCGEMPPGGRHEEPVVGGRPVADMWATVRLTQMGGGLCSGSLVAPGIVMTAKHCLDRGVWGWQVGFGPFGNQRPVWIEDAILAPDAGGPTYQDEDIAFAILEEDVDDVEPYPLPWDRDGLRLGDDIRLIGYGGTEDDEYGRKYEVTDRVVAAGSLEFMTMGNGVCGGDSGGTGLDEDGAVVGVIVRGPEGCELPPPSRGTALTRAEGWMDLAREAFDLTGTCYPTAGGEEVCDGRDNDCNGFTDEGCDPIGAPCEESASCMSGTCEEVEGERICTNPCDPAFPAEGCGPDAHCRETDCAVGWCVGGAAGAAERGASCAVDTDCASLRCADVGVCGDICILGEGDCPPGEVCVPMGDCETGTCVPEERAPAGSRGLGEPCSDDSDCAGGTCLRTDYGRYCSTPCDGPDACPAGYHCEEGDCRRGDPGATGDPCRTNADCASGICARWDDGSACTDRCGEDVACPEGFSCVDTAGGALCEPDRAPTGSPCERNADCLRGLCGRFADGSYCTEICDELDPCPVGFECVETTGDLRVCALPSSTAEDTGCGCRTAAGAPAAAGWALVLAGLLRTRRRR